MLKAALVPVVSAFALGLAALAQAQDASDDELYVSINEDRGPWFLQRSTCTLAHNVNGDSLAVVRLRIGMGVEMEFVDPALRSVRQGASAEFDVAVDGASEWSMGVGIDEGNRRGYSLSFASQEIRARIAAGRRLEARSGGRTLLQLDLAGARPAIEAMAACSDAMVPVPVDGDANMAVDNAMAADMESIGNGSMSENMSFPNAM